MLIKESVSNRFTHFVSQGWVVASDSITEQIYMVRGLLPDTPYMFLVRAQNSHGLSQPSQVTAPVRTTGQSRNMRPVLPELDIALVTEKLTGNVVNMLQPKVISSTAIQLNWEVRLIITTNAIVSGPTAISTLSGTEAGQTGPTEMGNYSCLS
jgi:roundabout axon guidance receptor 2